MAREEKVSEVARELYHYTSLDGLKGIFGSQCFRATRYDHLNDSSELHHFETYASRALKPFIESQVSKRSKTDVAFRNLVKRHGGPKVIALLDARKLIRRFYEVTFVGDSTTPAFATPFIASFCSHSRDDAYTRKNGLLSQWRGYGREGGFALVFDSRKLESMLGDEVNSHSYSFLNICDAVYNTAELNFPESFSDLLQEIEKDWAKHVLRQGEGARDEVFNEFVKGAARFKHQAFFEEREFRVVACPMSAALENFFQGLGIGSRSNLPIKDVETDERGRPIITLFRQSKRPLPIKRIIVGPHTDQRDLLNRARAITSGAIRLDLSETPLIG